MTKHEFDLQYARLITTYPNHYLNDEKMNLIFKFIEELSASWWKNVVDRIILSSKPTLDIYELAAAEKRSLQKTLIEDSLSYMQKVSQGKITPNGLQKYLNKIEGKSLWDAVENKKFLDANGQIIRNN